MDTILITVDALRADHLSQYGYERETMPVLQDCFAEGTTQFENAFANGTHTGISLPSLLTSRYLGDNPAINGPTIASALPDGVTTVGLHSNTYFAARIGEPAGFDIFEDFDVGASGETEATRSSVHRLFRKTMDAIRPTVERFGLREKAETMQRTIFPARLIHESTAYETAERTTNRALELVDDVEGELFLWVHYMDPHRPFCMHLDEPEYTDERLSSEEIHDLMSEAGINPDQITAEERELLIDLYDSELRYTSREIRRLINGLRDRSRWKNSNVIFTADHGEEFGEHGYYYHRNRPYDELLHVPMFVKGPHTGESLSEQRALLDVAPTICDWHDVSQPGGFLGEPLFEGDSRRVIATGSFTDSLPVVAGRWGGWKYIKTGDVRELYDLTADPYERENMAAAEPDRAELFHEAIPERLMNEDHSGVPTDTNDEVSERLADLGYLE
jgi:arylsulfatase A-like enzyme